MILRVSSSLAGFKTVSFTPGFNVVLAERTKESTRTDTRNGLGKTTLLEVMSFCLGANAPRGSALRVPELAGSSFSLDLEVAGRRFSVERSVDNPGRVLLSGDTIGISDLEARRTVDGSISVPTRELNLLLGQLMFALSAAELSGTKYAPSFRSLISYFLRRGLGAFLNAFQSFQGQREWHKQVNVAYLLGLDWELAREWQVLRDRQSDLAGLQRAAESGELGLLEGDTGELEALRIQQAHQMSRVKEALSSFRVHPEYEALETAANSLTRQINQANNSNVRDRRLLEVYEESLASVDDVPATEVIALYEDVGISMPGTVVRSLEEVQSFHRDIVGNRRRFLAVETERLRSAIEERASEVKSLDRRRANLLRILNSHGALDTFHQLQNRLGTLSGRLEGIERQLEVLRKHRAGTSVLRVDRETLFQRAERDYDERLPCREAAVSFFAANSAALYGRPGNLIIEVRDTGYRFGAEIERTGSQGVERMKIFCMDLTFAQLWAGRDSAPNMIVHDSTIFDGVDERQKAHALELAAAESETLGFQYICMLNSDEVPYNDFSHEFDLDQQVRLSLTDTRPDGGLLGFRIGRESDPAVMPQ